MHKYNFNFHKYTSYNKKILINVLTEGEFNVTLYHDSDPLNQEYIFKYDKFIQKGLKEPLIFSPFKWIFYKNKNEATIKSKNGLEAIWKRYRDKYNKRELQASLLMHERLFFHTPRGLENYSFSYNIYLPFFINTPHDLKVDDIIEGIDWLLIPIDIPVNTHYKCKDINQSLITLEGWITLDKEKLDDLLTKDKFRNKAKDYHFSQDFSMDSEIKITLTSSDLQIKSCSFQLEIIGKNLKESMKYEIKRKEKRDPYTVTKFKIIDPY